MTVWLLCGLGLVILVLAGDALVKGAVTDPSCGGNPIALTEENLTALFKAAL